MKTMSSMGFFLLLLLQQNAFPQFIEQTSIILPGIHSGSAIWGDYDNDGDLDILLSGSTGTEKITRIYRNNGDNTFSEQTSVILSGVDAGSAAWGDYDNDGDLDILLTGNSNDGYISKIYRNNGDNTFTENTSVVLTGFTGSSCAWADFDNDGDLDIFLAGKHNNIPLIPPATKLYRNTGSGFVEQGTAFAGIMTGSIEIGDYDNDNFMDVLITGDAGGSMNYISKLYRNSGTGSFIEQSVTLSNIMAGSAVWGDYDNDGDLDILLAGFEGPDPVTKLYRNDGSSFTLQSSVILPGIMGGSVAWGDYDNDGSLDILLAGGLDFGLQGITKIFHNNGDNTFTEAFSLPGMASGKASWGDYDNDGDLDILINGYSDTTIISKVYKNMTPAVNTLPSVPGNLSNYLIDDNTVILQWNKSTDGQTPQDGLRYNFGMGTLAGGIQIVSPMSDTAGYRKIISLGNTNHNNSWKFKLTPGRYFWRVQAMDNTFAGSAFSAENKFAIIRWTLHSGWNFVSIPGYIPGGQNPQTWFPGKDPGSSVFKFNWGYQAVTTLIPGNAYWIKHIGITTYTHLVNIIDNEPIPLNTGWNGIGVYTCSVNSANVTTVPSGIMTGSFFSYNGGYTPATILEPGKGYWLKSTTAGWLIIPGCDAGLLSATAEQK